MLAAAARQGKETPARRQQARQTSTDDGAGHRDRIEVGQKYVRENVSRTSERRDIQIPKGVRIKKDLSLANIASTRTRSRKAFGKVRTHQEE